METPDNLLSKEQLELVNNLTEQQLKEIDDVLLSHVKNLNRKVAMIVGLTMMDLSERIEGIPDIYYGQRVKKLVEKGLLIADGNLDQMRYSEVRLP